MIPKFYLLPKQWLLFMAIALSSQIPAYAQFPNVGAECGTNGITFSTSAAGGFSSSADAEDGLKHICIQNCKTGQSCTSYTVTATFTASGGVQPTFDYLKWETRGDITGSGTPVTDATHTTVNDASSTFTFTAVQSDESWGKGRIRLIYSTTTEPCTCVVEINTFQSFTPEDKIVEQVQCLELGKRTPFQIDAKVSRNGYYQIGTDKYYWSITPSTGYTLEQGAGGPGTPPSPSGDGNSCWLTAGSTAGPAVLSVVQGTTCNSATTNLSIGSGLGTPNVSFSGATAWRVINTNHTLNTSFPIVNPTRLCISANAPVQTSAGPPPVFTQFPCTLAVSTSAGALNTSTIGPDGNGQFTITDFTNASVTVRPTLHGLATLNVGWKSANNNNCAGPVRTIILDRQLASNNTTTSYNTSDNTAIGGIVSSIVTHWPTSTDTYTPSCLTPGQTYTFTLNYDIPGSALDWGMTNQPTNSTFTVSTDQRTATLVLNTNSAQAAGGAPMVWVRNPNCYISSSNPVTGIASKPLSLATTCTVHIDPHGTSTFSYEVNSTNCSCIASGGAYCVWKVDGVTKQSSCSNVFESTEGIEEGSEVSVEVFPCSTSTGCCFYGNSSARIGGSGGKVQPSKPAKKALSGPKVSSMSVTPNPGHNTIVVKLPFDAIGNDIRVVDATGRTVLQVKATGAANTLNVNKLPKGSYNIMHRSGKAVQSVKFIKE